MADRGKDEVDNDDPRSKQINGKGKVWSRLNGGGFISSPEDHQKISFGRDSYAAVAGRQPETKKVVVNDFDHSLAKEWLGISLAGKVTDYEKFNRLHLTLGEEGYENTQIRHIGGLQVLLTFRNREEAELFKSDLEPRKDIFTGLHWWEGHLSKRERLVWLKIVGIPPHLWDSVVFDKIGENFGEVVFSSPADAYDVNLAWKKIGVVSDSFDQIGGTILVEWGRNIFRCRVSEYVDDWMPEFVYGQSGLARTPARVQSTVEKEGEEKSTGEHIPTKSLVEEVVSGDVTAPLLADKKDVGCCQKDCVGQDGGEETERSTTNPSLVAGCGPQEGQDVVKVMLKKVGLGPTSSKSSDTSTNMT
ncbi:hypothetical protein SSX86_032063 [Deinandra increscens subsp. villosa]|uniref:DUF4283 domain-containing protein n=1 Tax=Deinandra increscens subsp. villosa TaxID=3103831 RepID=A0AAP0C472_9ASTR